MKKDLLSLGIDTSNYKTSVAVTDSGGNILFNYQQFLKVKSGERGLRQSEALFQHVQNLPCALKQAFETEAIKEGIGVISVSSKPRPVEDSYMPVFTAGLSAAKSLSYALDVPLYEFSHQEGHIEAVKHFSGMSDKKRLICFHFSGGTSEAILRDEREESFKIVGGSLDIAYGQVLDRAGVAMGFDFPCGQDVDRLALCAEKHPLNYREKLLTKIKTNDGYVNLSGIDTQCRRLIESQTMTYETISSALMETLSRSVLDMTIFLSKEYNIDSFLYAGGVSCSQYMRKYLGDNLPREIQTAFGRPELSSDNAVGISLLGGKKIWR